MAHKVVANQTIYFHLFGGGGKFGYVPGPCDEGERHSAARVSEGVGDENAKQQNHGRWYVEWIANEEEKALKGFRSSGA